MAHARRPPHDAAPRAPRRPLSARARTGLAAAALCAGMAGWLGAGRLGADPAAARSATEPPDAQPPGTQPPGTQPLGTEPSASPRAAPTDTSPAASVPAVSPPRPVERSQVREAVAQRIDALHRKLRITPAEQPLWDQFAATMLRNALDSEARFRARQAQPAPGAAEGLAERAQAAQSRADMLQHLSASFRALYEAMAPDQRLLADQVFRQAQRQEGRHGMARALQD